MSEEEARLATSGGPAGRATTLLLKMEANEREVKRPTTAMQLWSMAEARARVKARQPYQLVASLVFPAAVFIATRLIFVLFTGREVSTGRVEPYLTPFAFVMFFQTIVVGVASECEDGRRTSLLAAGSAEIAYWGAVWLIEGLAHGSALAVVLATLGWALKLFHDAAFSEVKGGWGAVAWGGAGAAATRDGATVRLNHKPNRHHRTSCPSSPRCTLLPRRVLRDPRRDALARAVRVVRIRARARRDVQATTRFRHPSVVAAAACFAIAPSTCGVSRTTSGAAGLTHRDRCACGGGVTRRRGRSLARQFDRQGVAARDRDVRRGRDRAARAACADVGREGPAPHRHRVADRRLGALVLARGA